MKPAFTMNTIMTTAADIVPLIWILMIWNGLCSRAVKSAKCTEQEMIIVSSKSRISGGNVKIAQTTKSIIVLLEIRYQTVTKW